MIGTIFASEADLQRDEAFQAEQSAIRERIADSHPQLAGCIKRREQGETRYYSSATLYALFSRSQRVLWFKIRPDGHTYALGQNCEKERSLSATGRGTA